MAPHIRFFFFFHPYFSLSNAGCQERWLDWVRSVSTSCHMGRRTFMPSSTRHRYHELVRGRMNSADGGFQPGYRPIVHQWVFDNDTAIDHDWRAWLAGESAKFVYIYLSVSSPIPATDVSLSLGTHEESVQLQTAPHPTRKGPQLWIRSPRLTHLLHPN